MLCNSTRNTRTCPSLNCIAPDWEGLWVHLHLIASDQ